MPLYCYRDPVLPCDSFTHANDNEISPDSFLVLSAPLHMSPAWWEVVIGQEEAKTVAQNALSALKDCYEIAIETLGRRGRWKQAFELLAEASSR